jgi:hypothetical protein
MSDGGGDMGGGGVGVDPGAEAGGGGKGTGGGSEAGSAGKGGNTQAPASEPATYGGYSDPTASYAATGPTGGLEEFVQDPSYGNLTGPGPTGGGTGVPGEGGGTNTPFAFENSGYLSGLEQYGGSPIAAGGTSTPFSFEPGLAQGLGLSEGPNQSAFETATGNQAAAPGGASAAGFAAPSAVSGNPDPTSSTELSSVNRKGAGGGVAAGGESQSSDIMSSLGIGKANMGSAAVGAAGLLNNLITGNKAPAQSANLTANASSAQQTAAQQTSAGQALQQWQTTGTLPASYESQVQRAAQDAKTRAISNAAAQGLPTDPTLNTALAQQLNAIDAAIPGQREAIAAQLAATGQQMINAGLQATGISSGVYQTLANLENSKNQQRGQAIANFASALNGGSNKGLTLKVA